VQLDPQRGYVTTAWWLEYATALKLVNWPDRAGPAGAHFVLEAAQSFAVSNRGKTYTFVIRKGLRFSDGSPVTARSFAYAIDRVANKQLASPGAAYITDSNGTNIVGAKRVNDGYATHVSGVTAKGYRLVIRLTKPDGTFLSKLTMPFFQATSRTLPLSREVESAYPSAGPYAFTKHVPDSLTKLRRNRYCQGSRTRHHMGFRPGDVTYKTWPSSIGVPTPTDWDIIPNLGWCADYPDPYDFFVPFLGPESPELGPAMVIDSKAYRRKIAAAARLVGNRRRAAFGKLDLDISRNLAPVAPMRTFNKRYLFSFRVDPRSLVYNSVYGDWSIPALALK
jgi:ABC-type oligopeptide transport system substrate-binding subunit